MTKTRIAILTLLVGAIIAVTFSKNVIQWLNAIHLVQNEQALRLEIPNAKWEPYFFKNLEERTKKISLPSLRTVVLPDKDLEVRFWFETLDGIRGLTMRRYCGKWSAVFLRETREHQSLSLEVENLEPPISGWETVWTELVSKGILTFPDQSFKEECKGDALDGIAYVVETNINSKYRTFSYVNPQYAKCDEAKQMVSIQEFIASEFEFEKVWLGASAKAAVKKANRENNYWEMLDKTKLDELEGYLEEYPNGSKLYLANVIIRNIKTAKLLLTVRSF